MAKQKKMFSLSTDAVEKLQLLANNSHVPQSQMLEALIMLADSRLVVKITEKKEYTANI